MAALRKLQHESVAAHLDEVHQPCQRILHEVDDRIFATTTDGSLCGIGADDKNGVWIAIQLLRRFACFKVALFVEEEKLEEVEVSGCQGAKACSLDFFKNTRFIIEYDRKGCSDFVTHNKYLQFCQDDFIPRHLLTLYNYKACKGGGEH